MREDLSDEKNNAQESRSVIHRRLDEQAKEIAHLDTTIAISGLGAILCEDITRLWVFVCRLAAGYAPLGLRSYREGLAKHQSRLEPPIM
uniref:Uncharacterized protein n=1 Tax=Rhizobium leguminosarum TaxID=384 RepID=A0A179BNQ0_RHILE|nr:hypothetical protein A4U53_25630 [Rhizobium leguminosarum]